MSNTNPVEYDHSTEKVIEIKPFELINPKNRQSKNSISLDEEGGQVQYKILKAKEELQELEQQKDILLHDTIAEIKHEKDNWEKEKQVLIKQAKESGFDQGFTLGKKESIDQYKELLTEANSIVSAATIDYYTKVEQSEETIVKLAIHTAEKIIKQKLSEQPEIFLDIVIAAISEIKDQSVISIYLHPNNYKFVTLQKDELISALDGDANLSIYIDQEITENSCLIEHPFGQVDASIDTQLNQIRSVLNEVVTESRE